MRVLEASIEDKAVEHAERLGYIHFKVTPAGQVGWPDQCFISRNGLHVYIEFKRLGKKLRAIQDYRRDELKKRGVLVYGPVDTLEEAREILDEHL